jgi:hypothetical protein
MVMTGTAAPPLARGFAGRAFGIELNADFGVPGLLEAVDGGRFDRQDARRIELTLGDAASAEARWPAASGERTFQLAASDGEPVFTIDHEPAAGYRVWIAGLGQCLIAPAGDRILCSPPQGRARWQLLIGQGLPIAAALQGLEVLHASAVRTGSSATAFIAPSGTGKTSLALHLLAHGAAFLADDVVALEAAGDALIVHPGIGLAHAPRAERASLDRAGVEVRWPSHAGPKRHVRVSVAPCPVPLGAAYFLERTAEVEEIEIVALDPPDPCLLLAATFVSHVPVAHRLITQLDVCSRIARTVPLFRVRTPSEGTAELLAERIAWHMRNAA